MFKKLILPSPPLPSTQPINSIHLRSRRRLRPRPLSPNWQPHRMSPSPMRPHIPQSSDILPQFPPEVILYFHARKLCRDVEGCLV